MKGIGVDIVSIQRIFNAYRKYKRRFLTKIFNNCEIDFIENIPSINRRVEKIAGMYACKEAIIKSFNDKIHFRDIIVKFEPTGKPYGVVNNKKVMVSISHEKNYAVAIAFLQ